MSPGTGRSRPSDLLVDEDEGVAVPELPRGSPVYRNDRPVTLVRSREHGPSPRSGEDTGDALHKTVQGARGDVVGRVRQDQIEPFARFAKEPHGVTLHDPGRR